MNSSPCRGAVLVDARRAQAQNRPSLTPRKEVGMSWSLKGSYVETCSCELMCPCNFSFDHGADLRLLPRHARSSTSREGEIEGTDVGGLKVAAIADTPKVMTEGNWRSACSSTTSAIGRAGRQAGRGLQRTARRPDGGARAARSARCSASSAPDRGASTTGSGTACGSATRSTSRSRTSSRSASRTGEPVRFDGMFHPVGSELTMAEAKRSNINAFGIEYEGKSGLSTSEFSWAA